MKDRKKWEDFSKECKEMLEQSKKNEEEYKKALEVFKNGKRN